MATYLIGYDLNASGQDYKNLTDSIKEISNGWWHNLDSTWVIKHAGPATTIRNSLKQHLDSNDELLVVKLSGEGAWTGFHDKGSKWLKDNL